MKTLAIIGSGDLGCQIAHYAITDGHYEKIVFFDDFTKEKKIKNWQILGNTDQIRIMFAEGKFDELIIGIGYKHLEKRKELFEYFEKDIPFGKVVHSSSWLDPTVKVHQGCVVYPRNILDAGVIINKNTILNLGTMIAHDSEIGAHCFVSPGVAIAGFVDIEEQCIIGINSTIIDNIKMVKQTQIGGGTVVINNILEGGLYCGNPHRLIR